MHDVIVVGAGLGGMVCAAKLASAGLKVLVLEKKPQAGGTSYIFRRQGFAFPMGPLSFSHPGKVKQYLAEAGVEREITFLRSHFRLLIPGLDIVFSRPLSALRPDLKSLFPHEADGLDEFLDKLERNIRVLDELETWHPDYAPARFRTHASDPETVRRIEQVRRWAGTPCAAVLDSCLSDARLKNFLGSQGAGEAEMSWLNLCFMWNVMSEVGIWFPSTGIHGLCDLLRERLLACGAEIRLATPVSRILADKGRACGAQVADGRTFRSGWVVANADHKKTFLELLSPSDVPAEYLERVKAIPYTGSELCVYLGVDPGRMDLGQMTTEHLFWRARLDPAAAARESGDFGNREVEICFWSRKAPGLTPPGRASLVLRTGFPYEDFAAWRSGEKSRKPGYRELKQNLARRLISTVEQVLPGLSSAVEVMEAATPLTYEDWGNRTRGSVAGWTWTAEGQGFGKKVLVETPLEGLLAAGLFASTELFLGGVPTAMFTGKLAADFILGR